MSPDEKVDSITNSLRQRILEGEFGTAGRLPSLRMLAQQFGTTQETINKVIQQLQAAGLLISQGRAGVFVHFPRTHIPGITPRFDLFLQQQRLIPVEIDLDRPTIVSASAEVATAFEVAEDTPVVRRYRLQGTLQGMVTIPYRLAESFYPVELAGGEILERMQQDVHFDVLEAIKETHGKKIKRVHEDIYGRLPTLQEQEVLKIVRNTPVLAVLRTNYASDEQDDDNLVIMYSRLIFVASYFVLSYDYNPPLLAE